VHKLWIVMLVLLAAAPAAALDLVIRQRVTNVGVGTPPEESTQYWAGGKMAVDTKEMRLIMDLDADRMTFVNKEDKTYYSESFVAMRERVRGVRGHMDKMRKQLEQQMEQMPPEARARAQQYLGRMGSGDGGMANSPAAELKPTGKTERIAGYDTTEYAARSGESSVTAWVAESLRLPPGYAEKALAATKDLGEGWDMARVMETLATVKGVPLRTTIDWGTGMERTSTTTEAVEVQETAPPTSVFEVPAGYKKIEPPQLDVLENPEKPGKPATLE